jgi:hypothetical protein
MTTDSPETIPFPVEDRIGEAASKLQRNIQQGLSDAESYVRREPVQAVLYSAVAGYFLRFFPFGALLRVFIALALASVRPLVLVCGLVKLYEIVNSYSKSARH